MRNLDRALRRMKEAIGPSPEVFISKDRLGVVSRALVRQLDIMGQYQLDDWKKLKAPMEEVRWFLLKVGSVEKDRVYGEAMRTFWQELQRRHEQLIQKWLACKQQERIRRYVYYGRLETLAQLMQMLLRRL